MTAVLASGWHDELARLIHGARHRLVVAAPFISRDGAALVVDQLTPALRRSGRIEVLTDLGPAHVCDGSLDLSAVEQLLQAAPESALWHVPRFHAKIYVADGARAIVTSGNLTGGALYRNVECGLLVDEPLALEAIEGLFQDCRATGTAVGQGQLANYAAVASEARERLDRQQSATDSRLRQAFRQALLAAEDELIRLRLASGPVHTVFALTIEHLLRKHGPMPTARLHEFIKRFHPDLCDDTIDRVIDGKRFGKKWKHAVRTAQQHLKRAGAVTYVDRLWRLADDGSP